MALSSRERIALILAAALLAVTLLLGQIARGQTPLTPASNLSGLGAGSYSWPAGAIVPNDATISGVRDKTVIYLKPDGGGQGMQIKGDGVTIRDVILDGAQVHLDKPGPSGSMNERINLDNVVIRNSTQSGLHFTSGLKDSSITNCWFKDNRAYAIYGYNFINLVLANNDATGNRSGFHIDSFGSDGGLIEQNYVAGVIGMGMEFQGTARRLVFQDNFYELPSNSPDNNNRMAYSLILAKSSDITIRRNYAVMPTKAQQPDGYVVIVLEVGGDNTLVEGNYFNGGNHVIAVNDGDGTYSVTVKNNRILNYSQGISAAFGGPGRTLVQSNNGPNVQLTWDINRPRPGRNRRIGTAPPIPPAPIPPTVLEAPPIASLMRPGDVITATGTGKDLRWEIDRENDSMPEIAKGTGNAITFTIPGNSTTSHKIRIRLYGAGGTVEQRWPITLAPPPNDPITGSTIRLKSGLLIEMRPVTTMPAATDDPIVEDQIRRARGGVTTLKP